MLIFPIYSAPKRKGNYLCFRQRHKENQGLASAHLENPRPRKELNPGVHSALCWEWMGSRRCQQGWSISTADVSGAGLLLPSSHLCHVGFFFLGPLSRVSVHSQGWCSVCTWSWLHASLWCTLAGVLRKENRQDGKKYIACASRRWIVKKKRNTPNLTRGQKSCPHRSAGVCGETRSTVKGS